MRLKTKELNPTAAIRLCMLSLRSTEAEGPKGEVEDWPGGVQSLPLILASLLAVLAFFIQATSGKFS